MKLSATCKTLGEKAFFCAPITAINLENVETVGDLALGNDGSHSTNSITTADLTNATTIGVGAFVGCTALETVTAPKAKTIGFQAFYYCTSLKTVSLGAEEFTYVAINAFEDISGGTLYLNANQSSNITVSNGTCTWTPVSGGDAITLSANFSTVYCGETKVYPAE